MSFTNQVSDFADFLRFSLYEILQNSDFFEETHFNFAIFTENETFEVRFKDESCLFLKV